MLRPCPRQRPMNSPAPRGADRAGRAPSPAYVARAVKAFPVLSLSAISVRRPSAQAARVAGNIVRRTRPINAPSIHYPGLAERESHDPEGFPCSGLGRHAEIRGEFERLMASERRSSSPISNIPGPALRHGRRSTGQDGGRALVPTGPYRECPPCPRRWLAGGGHHRKSPGVRPMRCSRSRARTPHARP